MPHGRPTRLHVALTPAERLTLHAWLRSSTVPRGRAQRARMILLVADGRPITHIARTVGSSRTFVYKWVARFQAQGCVGLVDRPHPGRPHHQGGKLCRGG